MEAVIVSYRCGARWWPHIVGDAEEPQLLIRTEKQGISCKCLADGTLLLPDTCFTPEPSDERMEGAKQS